MTDVALSSDQDSDAEVLLAFVERHAADRSAGRAVPLIDYLKLWPAHQDAIAREYLQVEEVLAAPAESAGVPDAARISRLGPYEIERELGRGGQGTVYLATDVRLHRKVALKVLHRHGPGAGTNLQRFRREAEAASRIDSPGICGIHDVGIDGGVSYIAMPFVDGDTLATWLGARRRKGGETEAECLVVLGAPNEETAADAVPPEMPRRRVPLSRAEIQSLVRIFRKAAFALHAAHEVGILHRDIKPANLIVTKGGQPVILDFGLAHLEDETDEGPSLTKTGELFGTPAYMSPEQIAGTRIQLDRRTDVFSVGVMLYECLTLQRPFEGATRASLYQAILTKSPLNPRSLNAAIPRDLGIVLATALEKDRDRRYATAELLAHELGAVLEGLPIQARPVGPIGRFVRWSKREPSKAALLAVVVAALPALATLWTSHVKDRPLVEAARLAAIEQEKEEILSEASFELSEGDGEKAFLLYGRALELEGESPEAAGGLVLASLRVKNPERALLLLETQQALLGTGAAALLLRADCLRACGRLEEAASIERRAPPPGSAFEHQLLAQKELHKGERGDSDAFGCAVQHVTAAILQSPAPRLSLYTLRAHAAGHAKDPAAVRATADALTARRPDSAAAQRWAGFAWVELDDDGGLDQAGALLRESIRLQPDLALTHVLLGIVLDRLGHPDDAIKSQREAIRLDPQSASAHFNLAGVLRNRGFIEEAVAAARMAVNLRPEGFADRYRLGVALAEQGHLDEAIAAYREAIARGMTTPDAFMALGSALGRRGIAAEAKAMLRRAIEMKRDYAEAHCNLGIVLHDEGSMNEAIEAFRTAIRHSPNLALAHRKLSDLLFGLGRSGEAIAAYRSLVRVLPEDFTAHLRMGDALRQAGILDEATASYRTALRLNENSAETHCNLAYALRDQQRLRDSLHHFRRGHELGAAAPHWKYPSGDWLAEAARLAAAEAAAEAASAALREPDSESERPRDLAVLAHAALRTGDSARAVRWFQSAFEDEPNLESHLASGYRRLAARAALLSAADQGQVLTDAARVASRLQALSWLETDCSAMQEAWTNLSQDARQVRIAYLPLLQGAEAFAVRDAPALAALSPAESARWRRLWVQIEALLRSLDS